MCNLCCAGVGSRALAETLDAALAGVCVHVGAENDFEWEPLVITGANGLAGGGGFDVELRAALGLWLAPLRIVDSESLSRVYVDRLSHDGLSLWRSHRPITQGLDAETGRPAAAPASSTCRTSKTAHSSGGRRPRTWRRRPLPAVPGPEAFGNCSRA
jgi:hypothetical protein